jgi:hypothetical protein
MGVRLDFEVGGARRAERDAQEKVRALMELGVSNDPAKLPPVPTE